MSVGFKSQPVSLAEADAERRFLRQLLDAAGEMIVAATLDGKVTFWNRKAEQEYGWSSEEAIGRSIAELARPSMTPEEAKQVWAQVAEGRPWSGDMMVRHRDGTKFPIHVLNAPLFADDGTVVGVVGLARNITQQLATREALLSSERRWQSLAEGMPALISQWDARGKLVFYNLMWEEYTGIPLTTLYAPRGWQTVVHPQDVRAVRESWREAKRAHSSMRVEFRIRRRDGEYRWHIGFAVPIRDEGGGVESWVGASLDIHDRKLSQEHLEAMNSSKDEFLGLVSHELKTPLTTILGNAELMRRGVLAGDDDVTAAVSDVYDASQRLQRIIDNMLVLSRLESGDVVPTEPVRVEQIARRVIAERFASRAQVAVHADAIVPLAEGEPGYIEQIFVNLLNNAEKYSPKGAPIDVEVIARDGEVRASVLDRGPGVRPEEIQRIFGVFYRSEGTARGAEGIGIGLAVCRRLIEAQRGRLWAEPRDGGGLTVHFTLPLNRDEP